MPAMPTTFHLFGELATELQMKIFSHALDVARDDPQYDTLLSLSILASMAQSWRVRAYIELSSHRNKYPTTMPCVLARLGSAPENLASALEPDRKFSSHTFVHIDHRIGVLHIMGANRLARQVGLEWWLRQIEAFEWTGYDPVKIPTLKQRLCDNIHRLIAKTQTVGGVVEAGLQKYIDSKDTAAKRAKLYDRNLKSVLFASGIPKGVPLQRMVVKGIHAFGSAEIIWDMQSKESGEQIPLLLIKSAFEAHNSAMTPRGLEVLRQYIMSNGRRDEWFLNEYDAARQAFTVWVFMRDYWGRQGTVGEFYEQKSLRVKITNADRTQSLGFSVGQIQRFRYAFKRYIDF